MIKAQDLAASRAEIDACNARLAVAIEALGKADGHNAFITSMAAHDKAEADCKAAATRYRRCLGLR